MKKLIVPVLAVVVMPGFAQSVQGEKNHGTSVQAEIVQTAQPAKKDSGIKSNQNPGRRTVIKQRSLNPSNVRPAETQTKKTRNQNR